MKKKILIFIIVIVVVIILLVVGIYISYNKKEDDITPIVTESTELNIEYE